MTGPANSGGHTPLPWKATVDGRAGEIVIRVADSTGRPIASMWINGDNMSANAALIVESVNSLPALREALEACRQFFDDHMDSLFGPDHNIAMAAHASQVISRLERAALLSPVKEAMDGGACPAVNDGGVR